MPRRAGPDDFSGLRALEHACFPPKRRESDASLRRALSSPTQEVWVLEDPAGPAAALMLRLHSKSVRLYSVAVDPDRREWGLGARLLQQTLDRAKEREAERIFLEADADKPSLVAWYARNGFQPVKTLSDYYGPGTRALRMQRKL